LICLCLVLARASNEHVLARAGGVIGRLLKKDGGAARQAAPDQGENPRAAKNAAGLDKRISAIEEKMRKFHNLVSRIDKALAGAGGVHRGSGQGGAFVLPARRT
jgi:hypothetical protein